MSKSRVLFTKNITPESLVNIYKGRELKGIKWEALEEH